MINTIPPRAPLPPDSDEPLFEAATAWYLRLREDASAEQGFRLWLREDSRHAELFAEAERLWGAVGPPARKLSARRRTMMARRPALITALAACLAFVLAGGVWLATGGYDAMRSDVVTAAGETRVLTLPDGSRMEINTGTALAFVGNDRRHIRLFRGEAYFHVAHNKAHPFIVEVPGGVVRDIGTRFDLRLTNGNAIVGVDEGAVSLDATGGKSVMLTAGRQAALGAAPAPFDSSAVTAWRRGRIVFYQLPLQDVARELTRYGAGPILIANSTLRATAVSGVFSSRDPGGAIPIIEKTLHARSVRIGSLLTVLY